VVSAALVVEREEPGRSQKSAMTNVLCQRGTLRL
jgi:hypothetical protein